MQMTQITCCIKKDFLEIIRNRRTLLFNSLLIAITVMVLGTTLAFPSLIDLLVEKAPDMVADGSQIQQVMAKLFPQTVKENMGIWASDIIIFFTIAISLVCCNLLPSEIRSGKWILVMEAGYSHWQMLFSKMLVYGSCTAFPVFVGYNLYYALCGIFISDNYSSAIALGNSVVVAAAVFFITTLSITLSVIYKNHIIAVITMVITVLAAPDILTMFSFGKLFPTYLLTFVYNSSDTFAELIIPCISLIVLQLSLYYIAITRFDKIEIAR
jgi:hypothetical protein